MREKFISFDTAMLATKKEFGYNCDHCYMATTDGSPGPIRPKEKILWGAPAPTQSCLQKWLREKHKIYIEIKHQDKDCTVYENIVYRNFEEMLDIVCKTITEPDNRLSFSSYEDALEDALKKGLKLIDNC